MTFDYFSSLRFTRLPYDVKGLIGDVFKYLTRTILTDITSSHDAVHVSDLYMPTLRESSGI